MVAVCVWLFQVAVILAFWLACEPVELKGKMALVSPVPITTIGGTFSGAWALRETIVDGPAGLFRDTVQVPDPPLAIDVGEQISDVN